MRLRVADGGGEDGTDDVQEIGGDEGGAQQAVGMGQEVADGLGAGDLAADEMRGRVMSVYNVAFRGGTPFGSLVTGGLVPVFGAPAILAANGVLLACLGLYSLLIHRRVAEL